MITMFYCAKGNEFEPEMWYKHLDDCRKANEGEIIVSMYVTVQVDREIDP